MTDRGAPLEGAHVIFHDEDGAVTGEVFTGASGQVTRDEAPSQVTVIVSGLNGKRVGGASKL